MTLFSRFLVTGVVKRTLFSNQNNSTAIRVSVRLPQFRIQSHGHHNHTLGLLHNVKGSFLGNHHNLARRSYSVLSASNVVKQHAQASWQRFLYRVAMNRTWNLSRITQIAQVVSLSLARSHFLLPGFLALTLRKVAYAQMVAPSPVVYSPSTSISL